MVVDARDSGLVSGLVEGEDFVGDKAAGPGKAGKLLALLVSRLEPIFISLANQHGGVVYGVFREFSWSIQKRRSLLGVLAHREQILDDFTALLALQHANITLFASRLFVETFQQIRGTNQATQRRREID